MSVRAGKCSLRKNMKVQLKEEPFNKIKNWIHISIQSIVVCDFHTLVEALRARPTTVPSKITPVHKNVWKPCRNDFSHTHSQWVFVKHTNKICTSVFSKNLHSDLTDSRQAGRQGWTSTDQQVSLQSAELTIPSASSVSMPWVSFCLLGCAILASGFSCLFSCRSTVFLPGRSARAPSRFSRCWCSSTLLFFSLGVSRSRLVCPARLFSVTPLWADQSKQEGKRQSRQTWRESGSKVSDAHLCKQMHKWTCSQAEMRV